MKLAQLSILAVTAVFALNAVPTTVFAAEQKSKKQSSKAAKAAREKCEQRIRIYAGFARDIENWSKHHYELPADLSMYPKKDQVQADGVKRPTQTSVAKVTIYKNGQATQVSRTNYALVLQRHVDARNVIAAKGVDVKAYDNAISQASTKLATAKKNNMDYLKQWNDTFANVNCGSGDGHNKAKDLIKLRAQLIKKMHTDLKNVKSGTKGLQAAYKTVAKEYKKKLNAEKASTRKPTTSTGGVQIQ